MATRVILDVDTGSDDAVAVATALRCPDLDVLAICTVWGNLDVEDTTENTLRLVDKLGRAEVPVYKGCGTAMVKYLYPRGAVDTGRSSKVVDENGNELHIHYKRLSGLENPVEKKEEPIDAVTFYVNFLRAQTEKVTLIPVGPLTNLGEALSIAPDIAEKIEKIVIMGGGDKVANISPSAEANIWHDPEAAEIVQQCGAPVLWIPLDATLSCALNKKDCAKLRATGTWAADFAATLCEERIEFESKSVGGDKDNSSIHDALAVCSVIDESVLTEVEDAHVHIALNGYNEGETIIDRRCIPDKFNCRFAVKASHDKFLAMLCEYLGRSE
ncbi:MAG: nucleoside hydrolase [Oscillospiraceae bacterium]|nr:nucleoside hydrolase [Oscillospiraceae bacterium]